MRQVTDRFKKMLRTMGRQIDFIITYTENGQIKMLDSHKLKSITPYFTSNILKSAMKQLDFETTELLPKGTIVNARLGVLVDTSLTVKDVHQMKVNRLNEILVKQLSAELMGFEYISYGNYIVIDEPTYNADTKTYTYNCYDKMLYSMKDYETMNISYPITIRDYINAICTHLGLTFKNASDIFANYNKEIQNELYLDTNGNSLGYTFRDVLDELAQVTASIICINENTDELEIRYLNNTNTTINKQYLKDTNVEFNEKYGPINLIVLSRSQGADNIYYPEILPENPCEIKIEDNQIMNWDDRDTYMSDIYTKLNGLEYYKNEFNSTGILWYELADKYNIQVGEDIFPCIMLNDEVNVKQGLEEIIHTDLPEESETDYKKADTSDRKIKKTILTVNKQEGKIESIVQDIGDRSEKTTTITQDIDGIEQRVDDMEDITNEVEGIKTITLENCVEGSILELHIYGNNSVFDYLRVANDLIISDNLKIYGDSEITVTDENNNLITYELGIKDVLRQNGSVRDEYVLDDNHAKIIRKIASDGSILTNETIEDLGEFSIPLNSGTNIITIKNYSAPLKAKYVIKNDYTDIFATQVQMSSSINQTAQEINLEVRKKVDENEVISKINQSAEAVGISANKIELSANDVLNLLAGNTINLSSKQIQIKSENFNVDTNGNLECNNATMNDVLIQNGNITLKASRTSQILQLIVDGNEATRFIVTPQSLQFNYNDEDRADVGVNSSGNGFCTISNSQGQTTTIHGEGIITPEVTQTSLESQKKNFEKLDKGLQIIKDIDIYKYNLKAEDDKIKKHIGFIIGDNYKYSKEITSNNNDGADIYSFVSVCCKAIQEQQEQIENLQKEIKDLKGGK